MKLSKNKPGYEIFSPNSLRFKKLMLKAGNKAVKNQSIPELAKDILSMPESNNLDKHLMVGEVMWDHHGRNVVFPGDKDFFRSLLKSNFSLDGNTTLSLPRDSFILSMPKGFTENGVTIPSALVCYHKASERTKNYNHAGKQMGLESMRHSENDLSGLDSMAFYYQDPYEEEGVIVQVNQTPAQIAGSLKAETVEEFAEILGEMPHELVSPNAMIPSTTDHTIQYVITRLLAGISIYMSANNITELNPGLPNAGKISLSKFKPDLRYSFSHLPTLTSNKDKQQADGLAVRRFHFRQLRAPVYYQNEHKHREPGSRWVFVRAATLGRFNAEHVG